MASAFLLLILRGSFPPTATAIRSAEGRWTSSHPHMQWRPSGPEDLRLIFLVLQRSFYGARFLLVPLPA